MVDEVKERTGSRNKRRRKKTTTRGKEERLQHQVKDFVLLCGKKSDTSRGLS